MILFLVSQKLTQHIGEQGVKRKADYPISMWLFDPVCDTTTEPSRGRLAAKGGILWLLYIIASCDRDYLLHFTKNHLACSKDHW